MTGGQRLGAAFALVLLLASSVGAWRWTSAPDAPPASPEAPAGTPSTRPGSASTQAPDDDEEEEEDAAAAVEGPIVRRVGGRPFAPGARLAAPSFDLVERAREQFVEEFGPANPGESREDDEVFTSFFLIARNMAWVRDWSAMEDPAYDASNSQEIHVRILVAYERKGSAEERAWAVRGARQECEDGLTLASDAGREAAETCLALLDRFE